MKRITTIILILTIFLTTYSQKYQNFKVSIYCTAFDVSQMADTISLRTTWNEISRQLKVDKVYIETHRDLFIVDQKTLDMAKKFFTDRHIQIAGGITFTVKEAENFRTFCYSDPEDRKRAKEISEYTAKNFNEIILDDFFFTNCKDEGAIKDKGQKSWTQYRLDLMAEVARDLVVGPAKKVNPGVKFVIKFPNWYEHFQGLGFNLEKEPGIFDGIYTGTETREAVKNSQHLQQYLGYNIIRYFSNIAPGHNGGGWVDPYDMGTLDRYAEQLWITAFAKAPEITLFHFGEMTTPINPADRSAWQGQNTSFDFDEMMMPVDYNGSSPQKPTSLARVAGYSFETADKIIGKTGTPIGIKSYRPYHSVGEDFLQNYLGMIGLPMDERPEFPYDDKVILLTEEAKFDADIVSKIKNQLNEGKTVVITSGLLRVLQDKGLNDIAELRYTDRKAFVQDFSVEDNQILHSEKPILMQQLQYLTNDTWEIVSGISGDNGWPILLKADYSKGKMYVLTVPDNFSDLYNLPPKVLNKIREILCGGLEVSIEGPSDISLYLYDNNTFIVESFLDEESQLKIVTSQKYKKITDLSSNQVIAGEAVVKDPNEFRFKNPSKNTYSINLKPHSFRIFKLE